MCCTESLTVTLLSKRLGGRRIALESKVGLPEVYFRSICISLDKDSSDDGELYGLALFSGPNTDLMIQFEI